MPQSQKSCKNVRYLLYLSLYIFVYITDWTKITLMKMAVIRSDVL